MYIYIRLAISSCYGSVPLTLALILRDGGLNTLCHSCGFACQQRVLKTFYFRGYLSVSLYIYNRRINVKLKNLRKPHDLVLQMIKSWNLKFYWIHLAQNCKFALWRIYLYLAVNKTKFLVNVFITSQYYISSMIGIFSRKTLIQKSWKIAEWVRLFFVRLENHMNTYGSSSNFTSNIERF